MLSGGARSGAVIAALRRLEAGHLAGGARHYYQVRDRCATSAFGAYTAARFTSPDQERLGDLAVELARRGCAVMVSNSSAASIEALYRRAASASGAGLSLWRLPARRAINSRASSRGPVDELLLTNLEPRPEAAPGDAAGLSPAVRVARRAMPLPPSRPRPSGR